MDMKLEDLRAAAQGRPTRAMTPPRASGVTRQHPHFESPTRCPRASIRHLEDTTLYYARLDSRPPSFLPPTSQPIASLEGELPRSVVYMTAKLLD